jgi:hypothetical protein
MAFIVRMTDTKMSVRSVRRDPLPYQTQKDDMKKLFAWINKVQIDDDAELSISAAVGNRVPGFITHARFSPTLCGAGILNRASRQRTKS